MEKYYTIEEISKEIKISQKTVRRNIASKNLNAIKIGSLYRIYEKDFNDWMLKHQTNIELTSDGARDYEVTDLFGMKRNLKEEKKNKEDINWINIEDEWENPGKSSLTFVDLFSGAGGITKGFELAGLNGICGLDNMEAATKTYDRNFKHSAILGDIKEPEIKKAFYEKIGKNKVNIIAGGFPCQGFSMSGNRIVNDPRNSLYLEMLEIVRNLNPEFVVMENVEGLRSMLKGKIEEKIIEDFTNIGYKVNVTVLNAANYCVPQKRKRVIFICNKIGKVNYHPAPLLDEKNYMTTRESIQDLINHPDDLKFNHVRTKHSEEMAERLRNVPEGSSLYENYSDAWKKCHWEQPSCTIKENHGGVNIHPLDGRVLTAREMARLQSFPDNFIFEGNKSKQLVQIGNAVPPLLAKAIGLALRKSYGEI